MKIKALLIHFLKGETDAMHDIINVFELIINLCIGLHNVIFSGESYLWEQ